jgi:hypothetical protein
MTVLVPGYPHRTGEHCASTALRNALDYHGLSLSEPMIVGLSSGLGFVRVANDDWSPTRMFHGRTWTLEEDFGYNAALPFEDRVEPDDDRAMETLKRNIDSGVPVLVSTDTFYLPYHNTTSHFPGHRAVVVGYDDDAEQAWIADRTFEELQAVSYDALRRSRNASDYPLSCENRFGVFHGRARLGRPLPEAIRRAMRRSCELMLTPPTDTHSGVGGMRAVADELPSWSQLADWSWASRFGYQVVIKRGAGGSFFRSLYADFLIEAEQSVPGLHAARLGERMHAIAADWRAFAGVLKDQSERELCDPSIFAAAAAAMCDLADAEESFFGDLSKLAEDEAVWKSSL